LKVKESRRSSLQSGLLSFPGQENSWNLEDCKRLFKMKCRRKKENIPVLQVLDELNLPSQFLSSGINESSQLKRSVQTSAA
jgi:hypothetical protein